MLRLPKEAGPVFSLPGVGEPTQSQLPSTAGLVISGRDRIGIAGFSFQTCRPMSSPIIVLVELILAGVLALLAAADLVFARREWSATRRVIAWTTLALLTISAAVAFALFRNIPSW